MHHTTLNIQRATHNIQRATYDGATYDGAAHATCNAQRAPYDHSMVKSTRRGRCALRRHIAPRQTLPTDFSQCPFALQDLVHALVLDHRMCLRRTVPLTVYRVYAEAARNYEAYRPTTCNKTWDSLLALPHMLCLVPCALCRMHSPAGGRFADNSKNMELKVKVDTFCRRFVRQS